MKGSAGRDRTLTGFMRIGFLGALLTCTALAVQVRDPLSVRELPPEDIPTGTCTESDSGYLGVARDKKERTQLTDQEIGEYVRKSLAQGYSLTLYPQASGKIFAVANCHPTRP
jgi:hypothetical protein